MLARALSQQDNVIVHVHGRSAYVSYENGKFIIYVPVPCYCEEEDAYYRGYLDHELGHVKFSDMDALKSIDPQLRGFVNVLEDVYVEWRMGSMFPGSKKNLERLAASIFTEAHAAECIKQADNINDITLLLVLYARRGINHSLDIIGDRCRALGVPVDDIYKLLERQTYCTQDNIRLASDIYALLPEEAYLCSKSLPLSVEDAISSTFEAVQRAACRSGTGRRASFYVCTPRAASSTRDNVPLSGRIYGPLLRTLPPLLQSIQYRAGRTGYRGRVGRDIYKVAVADARVFEKKARRLSQSVQIIMLSDYSSSMSGFAYHMDKAVYAMMYVLRTIPHVDIHVYGYSSFMFEEIKYGTPMKFPCPDGLTPTGDAMLKVFSQFNSEGRRILFLFTDGSPSDKDVFVDALELYRARGIEIYGVGMRGMRVSNWFDEDHRVEVEDMENDFAPMVCKLLKKAMVKCVLRQ